MYVKEKNTTFLLNRKLKKSDTYWLRKLRSKSTSWGRNMRAAASPLAAPFAAQPFHNPAISLVGD
jgi:hypothetical protein